VKGWKKIFQANRARKQEASDKVDFISDKVDFKQNQKRQRKLLHIDKGNNPSRGYDNCKHKCSKYQLTQFHKANTTGHKSTDTPNTIIVGNINTLLSQTDRSSRPKKSPKNIRIKWQY
jgi:hypothetical protein